MDDKPFKNKSSGGSIGELHTSFGAMENKYRTQVLPWSGTWVIILFKYLFTEYHGERGELCLKGIEMDFEALKKSLREAPALNTKAMEKKRIEEKKEAIKDKLSGYYTVPSSGEGFKGDIIEYSGDEFTLLLNEFCFYSEDRLRDKLESMDAWLYDKPLRVQQNWIKYIPKWLNNDYI